MEHFAGYGFNKSHSTAYALLAYQTAYLKANYPWHFAAALLTIEAQNTDKLALYLGECRERGIPVLPPDINESQLRVHGRAGRRALRPDARSRTSARARSSRCSTCAQAQGPHHVAARAVRGARPAAGQQARVREPGQGRRVRLAGAGAGAAAVAALRPRLFAAVDARCEHGAALSAIASRARRSCSAAADDGDDGGDAIRRCPTRRRGPRPSSSRFEKETLGLYWSGHPLDRYAAELKAFGARRRRLADALQPATLGPAAASRSSRHASAASSRPAAS